MQKQKYSLEKSEKDKMEIRFKLNILTPKYLQEICTDFLEYMEQNEETEKIIIADIILMVKKQPMYINLYADLCKKIVENYIEQQEG